MQHAEPCWVWANLISLMNSEVGWLLAFLLMVVVERAVVYTLW